MSRTSSASGSLVRSVRGHKVVLVLCWCETLVVFGIQIIVALINIEWYSPQEYIVDIYIERERERERLPLHAFAFE